MGRDEHAIQASRRLSSARSPRHGPARRSPLAEGAAHAAEVGVRSFDPTRDAALGGTRASCRGPQTCDRRSGSGRATPSGRRRDFASRGGRGFRLAARRGGDLHPCGSRGLGHQILLARTSAAEVARIAQPGRGLACAPVARRRARATPAPPPTAPWPIARSSGICARSLPVCPKPEMPGLLEVSHATCKFEAHEVDAARRQVYLHCKRATLGSGPVIRTCRSIWAPASSR